MRAILTKGPVYTGLRFKDVPHGVIAECLGAVRLATSARPKGYRHMPSFKARTWDGYIKLFKDNRFPTGLIDGVLNSLRVIPKLEIDVVITEERFPECIPVLGVIRPDMFNGITLRDNQIQAARLLLEKGRGIAKMATNSGKTEVIAAMCKALLGDILVLTTKRELLYQTSERLSGRLGEPVGIVGDSTMVIERVSVAMIQTLSRHDNMSKMFGHIGCIMFDECHHIPSKTSQAVMFGIPSWQRFGFSGTPLHYDDLDDLSLVGATGPVLVEVSNADLIEAGVSSMPFIDMFVVERQKGFKEKWDKAYDHQIVHNDNRNAIIVREVLKAKANSTLILVDRLEHGRLLQSMLPGSIFAHGSLSTDERRIILDQLRHVSGTVVIATPIFDEGVDVPAMYLLVLAAGGETHIRLLQRIGRGMRHKETGVLRVIDFVDDTNKYLLEHSSTRAKVYEDEGFQVRIIE